MFKFKLISALTLVSICTSSLALDFPVQSPYDHRVRSAIFNPLDVVQIDTVIGVATHIQLEEGERYITHAFGDSASYSFANTDNHIFIKPIAEQADTNLIVITDKRTYKFRLAFQPTRNVKAFYSLAFKYPDTQRKRNAEEIRKEQVENGFKAPPRANFNTNYSMAGDIDIAPINVWDNNEFTYFKFAGNVDLAGIYLVDAEGNESIANRNTTGNSSGIYSVHKVNHKWMLRLGSRALAIYNDSFDSVGVENDSRTNSPAVKRVVMEDIQ